MVIVAFDGSLGFLETNIIETGKRRTADIFNCMVRYQKMFFPPHKNIVRVRQRFIIEGVRVERFGVLTK